LYEKITGEKLDLNIEPTDDEEYWVHFASIIYIHRFFLPDYKFAINNNICQTPYLYILYITN
jgi:hypothetical protein